MDMLEKTPRAEVTVYTPLSSPSKLPLPMQAVSIGRASDCTIPIRDRFLSRKHAEIVPVEGGLWILKDCGSANGTFVNGLRVDEQRLLHRGDRIRLGDSEILFEADLEEGENISVGEGRISPTISIPLRDIYDTQPGQGSDIQRLQILSSLAMELIEDKPLHQLFGFIADRVSEYLAPSRLAVALLADDGTSFRSVEVRRLDAADQTELTISRTLIREVVDEKKVLAFVDTSADAKLHEAKSIVMQGIRSAVIAPIMFGEAVAGVLYLDYLLTQHSISDEDVRLIGQVARLASIKLETTRLREESIEKRLIEEELRTAGAIQRRLLPDQPPVLAGFTLAGSNRPCRTVSGDYFDFVEIPDGPTWFVIGDVSGKGFTAALLMTSLQSAFRIFVKSNPSPAELTTKLNNALHEIIPSSKFVTLIAGRVDPATGVLEYANAGHVPPLVVRRDTMDELRQTDLLLGLFPTAKYRDHQLTLGPGESLVMFTDGAGECASPDGNELGSQGICDALKVTYGYSAEQIAELLRTTVADHAGDADDLGDDLTIVVVSRNPA